jgi:saccharopine dehydrogenase-like NADP-dependent oxidoreductase
MKHILLFGAGKSATVLIDYLIAEAPTNNWHITIADANKEVVEAKTNKAVCSTAIALDIKNDEARQALIQQADIVISLMPPTLHYFVANDCIAFGKHLLTASYVDEKLKARAKEIEDKGILFLCEMGLDPGIDHMSAMQLIDAIHAKGGNITSFKSHCGGLIAPESDNNPWHYKISWNPRNVVLAGKAGAVYKMNGEMVEKKYYQVFEDCPMLPFNKDLTFAYYPNRDSLSYIPIYGLESAATFLRTTLRYPAFCNAWDKVVDANLTDETDDVQQHKTIAEWSKHLKVNETDKAQFEFLGLNSNDALPTNAKTSADVLQFLLETKLAMHKDDKDMIVMMHEIDYEFKGEMHSIKSSLLVKGDNALRTAMAKTVGLPLGIAAKMILNGTIAGRGLQIPVTSNIYEPVLKELGNYGVVFEEVEY